jgi:hypothetical protein
VHGPHVSLARRPGVVQHCQESCRAWGCHGVDQARGVLAAPSPCYAASSPKLAEGARPPTSPRKATEVVHLLSVSAQVARPLNARLKR